MKTIAAEANVSVMTVSLALRNSARISDATKKRVLEVAERLAYRPNPMVSNLMVQIRSSRPVTFQATLAFLTAHATADGWKKHQAAVQAYAGMRQRADAVGFSIDTLWLKEPGMDRKRLSQILDSRNIQGVIVAPLPEAGTLGEVDWTRWSAAALGNSLVSPLIHRVTHHQFHGMSLILRILAEKGYRRIGLAVDEVIDIKVDRAFTSCLISSQLRLPAGERIPPFLGRFSSASLGEWLDQHRPDVVIGNDELLHHLKKLGISVPRDLAAAHFGLPSTFFPETSGLNQNWHSVGAAAVDTVVAQIYRNERGIPPIPYTVMLEGFWQEGSSTPGAP